MVFGVPTQRERGIVTGETGSTFSSGCKSAWGCRKVEGIEGSYLSYVLLTRATINKCGHCLHSNVIASSVATRDDIF